MLKLLLKQSLTFYQGRYNVKLTCMTCLRKKAGTFIMKKSYGFISLALVVLLMVTMLGPRIAMAEEVVIDLKSADSFAILAGSTITNTGTTTIHGDVGLHPGTVFSGQDTVNLNGELHIADAVALQAKNDLLAAFNNAAGRTIHTTGSELGGSTLTPGVYSSATSFQVTGTLTLDGQNNSNAVFIFQTGSALTTASGSNIELINGATYKNVFWQVGSSATLGTNSNFSGTILASESITATTGANIKGKLLAMGGAVTLDSNVINSPQSNSLTVTKVVTGDTGELTLPLFEITVTGPNDFSETKAFIHDESYTWETLAPGDYIVTENQSVLGENWTVSGQGSVAVMAGQEHFVTITNAYADTTGIDPADQFKGSLIIGKIVEGNTEAISLPSFEITVTGPNDYSDTRNILNNETYTLLNLEPGLYEVSENASTLSDDWTISGQGQIEVVADEAAMVTITNHYEFVAAVEDIEPVEDVDIIEDIPQTGQSTHYTTAITMGILGLVLAGSGMVISNRKKRFDA